jgi:hypothetical protein
VAVNVPATNQAGYLYRNCTNPEPKGAKSLKRWWA